MDLGARLFLLTSLGQLKQLRVHLPKLDFVVPPDVRGIVVTHEHGYILNLPDMEVDLYGKLYHLVHFLTTSQLLWNEQIEFEADLESNEDLEDFSVLLNSHGEVILLYTTHLNKSKMSEWVLVEWSKRLVNLYEEVN